MCVFYSHNILLYEDGHAVVADFGGKIFMYNSSNDISLFLSCIDCALYCVTDIRFHRDNCTSLSHSKFNDPDFCLVYNLFSPLDILS